MVPSGSAVRVDDPLHPDDSGGLPSIGSESEEQINYTSSDEDESHARIVSSWSELPWWKRPSPYWLILGVTLGSTGFSALLAPKVAMYTALACHVHRPEYSTNNRAPLSFALPPTHNPIITNGGVPIPYTFNGSETAVEAVFVPHLDTDTASYDYIQDEPDSQQKCASDPVVQAVVARLSAVFLTTTGILSCLTTGWWGSLSDRSGRRIVIFVSVFGLFVSDVTHIITAWFVDVLPGGYWFPLVGFFIEGLLGSLPAGTAAVHAYMADTTEPSTRSRYFALFLGLLFTGAAIGPVIGGLLMRWTGTVLSVFYFSAILHGVYAILILSILPESLTWVRARGARLRLEQERATQVPSGYVSSVFKSIKRLLSPLVVLLPEQSSDANPLKQHRKDWNLSLVAMAYGLLTSLFGSLSTKIQYTGARFGWTPEEISYFISYTGIVRAFSLTIILPIVIKYLKSSPIRLPSTPDEPLDGAADPSSGNDNSPSGSAQTSRSLVVDLTLARIFTSLDTLGFLGMAIATTGVFFTLGNTIGSLAGGSQALLQALALDIYTSRHPQNQGEVGKLFGALSVLQALGYVVLFVVPGTLWLWLAMRTKTDMRLYGLFGRDRSQIISPALYGFVYYNTVAFFPQGIIIVSMCTTFLALVFVSFVRVPRIAHEKVNEEGSQALETPELLIEIEDEAVQGR